MTINIYITKFNIKFEYWCDENAYRLLIITFNVYKFFHFHVYNIKKTILLYFDVNDYRYCVKAIQFWLTNKALVCQADAWQ